MFNFMNQKSAESGEISAINLIGRGTAISGNITCSGNLRIDGSLIGDIATSNKIVTGPESEIKGDLRIGSGKIGGKVYGNIYSSGTLEIENTALIEGVIESNGLIIHEGANLKAEINSKNKAMPKMQDLPIKNKAADFSRAAVL
jgi:cytoskeletal protein CcmA (bactofilin family)